MRQPCLAAPRARPARNPKCRPRPEACPCHDKGVENKFGASWAPWLATNGGYRRQWQSKQKAERGDDGSMPISVPPRQDRLYNARRLDRHRAVWGTSVCKRFDYVGTATIQTIK